MIGGIFKRIFGTSHERMMRKLQPLVVQINNFESEIHALSDEDLKAQTPKLKEMLSQGATLDDILPEAFATVREAGLRVLNMRHYDVQMIGGIVLHRGMIAEMKTGEGKTLVATSPMYLNALSGKGAHLVTVNDYLASRDADWMGQIYKFLGLSVGKILSDMDNAARRDSYNCDITYGTNNEFGFDYLRDNMKYQLSEYVQRGHNYAIVDEVDSILIDEARTPLIISGQLEQDLNLYKEINKLVPFLKRDEDYSVDEKAQSVALNETGIEKLEKHLKVDNIYDPKYIEYLHHVNKALQAHTLYKLDQNYVIENGKIVIIDDFTGRMMHGRRWSDGLHQAIEAKEGVEIQPESQTLATITFQNYFRMYDKLAGMTGTADTEAEEFKKIYKLDVVSIPTAKNIIRKDYNDVIYFNEKVKIEAIAAQIRECHEKGQPILVGTVSVEKSEVFSRAIAKLGIPHNVLNAKNHRREAEIIAQAGRKGAVTIATNMAGRGTDILLGGNAEFMARLEVGGDEHDPRYPELLEKYRKQCAAEKEEVMAAGGLYILGTERHESRRIDNQLRGRAGRQGDPGMSRFFLSLDDDLLRIFGGEELKNKMAIFGMGGDQANIPIESRLVSRSIETAQKRVEGRNFDIRKNLLEYDDVMNSQRKAVYALRNSILKGEDLEDTLLNGFEEIVYALADEHMPVEKAYEDWDMPGMTKELSNIMGCPVDIDMSGIGRGDRDAQLHLVWNVVEKHYQSLVDAFDDVVKAFEAHLGEDSPYKEQTGKDLLLELAQNYYLREIDHFWRAHLTTMTGLRESISLRGYAQKDPKQEYKREAFSLFEKMMRNIRTRVMTQICRTKVEKPDFSRFSASERAAMRAMQRPEAKQKSSGDVSHETQVEELRALAAQNRTAPKKALSMAELLPASIASAVKSSEKPKKSMSMADLLPASMRQAMEEQAEMQQRIMERMRQEAERQAAEAQKIEDSAEELADQTTESDELVTESAEPAAESAEPVAESDEPAAESAEPAAESVEPVAESDEPAAESDEPAADSAEPAAESAEPAAESDEPAAESAEPAAESAEPAAESAEPAAESDEPATDSADHVESAQSGASVNAFEDILSTPESSPFDALFDDKLTNFSELSELDGLSSKDGVDGLSSKESSKLSLSNDVWSGLSELDDKDEDDPFGIFSALSAHKPESGDK